MTPENVAALKNELVKEATDYATKAILQAVTNEVASIAQWLEDEGEFELVYKESPDDPNFAIVDERASMKKLADKIRARHQEVLTLCAK